MGVPDGMEVIDIQAVHLDEGQGFVGGWDGDLTSGPGAKLDFVPVSQVVEPDEYERFYLVVTVKATRPGEFHTKGVEVDWQADDRKGTTKFPYLIALIVPGHPGHE